MKWLLLLAATAGGFYFYGVVSGNPATIKSPVYVESRVDVEIPEIGRELEYVLLGEMASNEDCQDRAKRFVKRVLAECRECTITKLQCRGDLEQRYKKLFHGQTTYTTYLSLERGNRFERNGRMVIWGLNEREADMACDHLKKTVSKKYEGVVTCVTGRLS